ncbi:hypothetical protein [Dictyobacter kobayashii]|uniref:Uncharacterized protein n=1 Tax=Dictyobacter kobayashii TaxID=2014872 RepID=A0A402AT19_9CHLR|nr:hypothetical protein [Dictyobacter kobayashii]GCE22244.1 hypothetical protein KDK_60440 [Dictyobacter kobayashii]
MSGYDTWPTIQIFDTYRSHALKNEQPNKERIGIYTFQFALDNSGVIIQRGVYGNIEHTWEIHQSSLGSKEEAIKHHWTMLTRMSQNDFTYVETELTKLTQQ